MTGAIVRNQKIFIEPKVSVMADLSESDWCQDWCQNRVPRLVPTLGTVESL